MNSAIKNSFTIKDLENLSGIKAHTIRIWEKRYGLLSPMRTETNIRRYDTANLQKLLNIKLLVEHGHKPSAIGVFGEQQLLSIVRQTVSEKRTGLHVLGSLKMAMMNFDQQLFFSTYNNLLSEKSFRAVFLQVFIPLMEEIGLLWQSGTITPAHEHFISYLLRQKILTNTERLQLLPYTKTDRVFVLFLPKNEIHDIGLLYANYEIISSGYRTIYLGESIPIESIRDVKNRFENITFVTYLTVEPTEEQLPQYLDQFAVEVLGAQTQFWIMGRRITDYKEELPKNTRSFSNIDALISAL